MAATGTPAPKEQEFELTTTAQVERTYKVLAVDKDTAHKRLRRYIEDPAMIKDGVVTKYAREIDVTGQKVKTDSIKAISAKPGRASRDAITREATGGQAGGDTTST